MSGAGVVEEKKIRGFAVTLEIISELTNHQHGKNLQIAKLKGMNWQFVVGKDEFKIGEEVVYFPVDSCLPRSVADKLKLPGTSLTFTVRPLRIRGIVSQGILAKPWFDQKTDLATVLNVTKYQAREIAGQGCTMEQLRIPFYQLENAGNNKAVVDSLMDEKVVITEKLEGTNMAVTANDKDVFVSSHHKTLIPVEGTRNDYWDYAKEAKLLEQVQAIQKQMFPGSQVSVRGELIGPKIQKNIYKLKTREFRAFDILINDDYLSTPLFTSVCELFNIATVPFLCTGDKTLREILEDKSIETFSDGKSELSDTLREGVVIRPSKEKTHAKIGRLVIKQRSPAYLTTAYAKLPTAL